MSFSNIKQKPWFDIPKFKYEEKTITIIGAGIAGCSLAYEMANKGWVVNLIERNQKPAQEASGNSCGVIMPLISHKNDPLGELYYEGFKNSANYIALHKKEIKHEISGAFDLEFKDKNLSDLCVDQSELEIKYCAAAKKEALFIKNAICVNAQDFCISYLKNSKSKINLILNASALFLKKENDKWQVYNRDEKFITSSQVVAITCANDAKNFDVTKHLPIQKIRGQLTYVESDNLPKIDNAIFYKKGYVTASFNGFNYVGATFTPDNLSPEACEKDDIENLKNLTQAFDIAPIEHKNLNSRVAFRASTPDRRPIAGMVPNLEKFKTDYADLKHGKMINYPKGSYKKGLYISVGHGSKGLTSAPYISHMLAQMINGQDFERTNHLFDLISPARFIIRDIKRTKASD